MFKVCPVLTMLLQSVRLENFGSFAFFAFVLHIRKIQMRQNVPWQSVWFLSLVFLV
jgi:hypothetical protein